MTNHEKGERKIVECPFLERGCIEMGCVIWVELNRGRKKVGLCGIAAAVILLSEINGKMQVLPQQKVQLPGLYKG